MRAKDLPRPKPANRWLQSIPVMIVPLIILLLIGRTIGGGLSPTVDEAVLSNGLSIPYSVRLNGQEYMLRANSDLVISNVRYGNNTLEPVGDNLPFETLTFEINVPMTERMTDSQSVIVNPDQTAVILWQNEEYTTAEYSDNEYTLTSGKHHYMYTNIDFFFAGYPDEIEVSSIAKSAFRTRLSTLNDYNDTDRIESLFNSNEIEAGIAFLTNKLRFEPDASALLNYAAYVLPSETMLPLLASKLDQKPVLIQYHRQYQNYMELAEEDEALLREYRQRLADAPESPALTYLLGRIEPDPATSLALFNQAYAGSGAKGYGAFALAYHSYLEGDTLKAESLIDQAALPLA